ncbi:uncharacterized protein N7459_002870 [Penicillium hispanicum]|uniref:uncharacterized protein n=1 Tax=Penicillium hispanicum TaxID=1080232 RepID=UPI00253F8459|nr:uncharacterized protein N7459_002870 [Penicillium hispanicum]KAJ5587105.1 hypothetical protein N7459_002870 [Penicillium hispanicum]
MSDRWPEPPIKAGNDDSPFELAEKFKAHYQEIFHHTASYPTATASASYVMDLMFQANKVITMMRNQYIADTASPTINQDDDNGAPEVTMREATPESCTAEPRADAAPAGGRAREGNPGDVSSYHTGASADWGTSSDKRNPVAEVSKCPDNGNSGDDNDLREVVMREPTPEQNPTEPKAGAILAGDLLPEDSSDDDSDYDPEDDSDGSYSSDEYDYSDEDLESTDNDHGNGEEAALDDGIDDGAHESANDDAIDTAVDEVVEDVVEEAVTNAADGVAQDHYVDDFTTSEDDSDETDSDETQPDEAPSASPRWQAVYDWVPGSVEPVPQQHVEASPQRAYERHKIIRIRWSCQNPPYKTRKGLKYTKRDVVDMLRLAITKRGNPELTKIDFQDVRVYSRSGDVDMILDTLEKRLTLLQYAHEWFPFLVQSDAARIPGYYNPQHPNKADTYMQGEAKENHTPDIYQRPCDLARSESRREKRKRQKQRERERRWGQEEGQFQALTEMPTQYQG